MEVRRGKHQKKPNDLIGQFVNFCQNASGLEIHLKGGFPLSRNFYVRTDVNLNWLYVR